MFHKLSKLVHYLKLKVINDHENNKMSTEKPTENIPKSIKDVKEKLQAVFVNSSDFIIREVTLGQIKQVKFLIAFIDGLIDHHLLNTDLLKPLMLESPIFHSTNNSNKDNILDLLKENILTSCELETVTDFQQTIDIILSGDTVIYIDGKNTAFRAGTKGWEARGVEEPDTEAVVRGPREGFSETLRTNTSLIRRKIKNPKLKFESMTLGTQTNTDVCICYLQGIANEDIIETVRRRLKKIKIDAILESGYIEQFIEDAPFSIFSTVGNTEKPDIVAAKLLEGRVAILCDGTPFVLTVPKLFIESIQISEDYYSRPVFSSLVRLFRLLALIISTTLPAVYVASIAFHAKSIPFKLLLTMSASREGIPFSPFSEALMMGIVFELLREAGVRMPRPIGQAVSIVGALVLGEAAVKAGIASNVMVIITSLTAISSFIIPSLGDAMPILRIAMLIAANILGYLGILFLTMVLMIHLCSLRSFGVPFMAPLAPLNGVDLKDTFIRMPLWTLYTRPQALVWNNADTAKYRMEKTIIKKED
ncbi:spore germination protein [Clostridiaceae bacterium 35-E11]